MWLLETLYTRAFFDGYVQCILIHADEDDIHILILTCHKFGHMHTHAQTHTYICNSHVYSHNKNEKRGVASTYSKSGVALKASAGKLVS